MSKTKSSKYPSFTQNQPLSTIFCVFSQEKVIHTRAHTHTQYFKKLCIYMLVCMCVYVCVRAHYEHPGLILSSHCLPGAQSH